MAELNERDKAVEWLKYRYKGAFSELGKDVAWFLDKVFGLHHINRTSLSKVIWSNDTWVDVVIDKPLSTVDNADLTRLVVIAHQMMLRIELRGVGPGYVKLTFHKRVSRDKADGIYYWCPDIYEHVDMITKLHPAVDGVEVEAGR